MNRRHWLQTLFVAPLAAAITPLLAKPQPQPFKWVDFDDEHVAIYHVIDYTTGNTTAIIIEKTVPDWRVVNDDPA